MAPPIFDVTGSDDYRSTALPTAFGSKSVTTGALAYLRGAASTTKPRTPHPVPSIKAALPASLKARGSYISSNTGFRAELDELDKHIQNYASKQAIHRPFNVGLVAPPGSGKSYLIKQVGENLSAIGGLKPTFISFNCASLYSWEDLRQLFAQIRSHGQNKSLPVVLVDEVDSRHSGDPVYAKFLCPMADGRYLEAGQPTELGKCVLVFAASEPWDPGEPFQETDDVGYPAWSGRKRARIRARRSSLANKLGDFLDRIDFWLMIPPPWIAFDDTTDRDDELLAVAFVMIKKHFPGISEVEYRVGYALGRMMKLARSYREIDQQIFLSRPGSATVFGKTHLSGLAPTAVQDQIGFAEDLLQKAGEPDKFTYILS